MSACRAPPRMLLVAVVLASCAAPPGRSRRRRQGRPRGFEVLELTARQRAVAISERPVCASSVPPGAEGAPMLVLTARRAAATRARSWSNESCSRARGARRARPGRRPARRARRLLLHDRRDGDTGQRGRDGVSPAAARRTGADPRKVPSRGLHGPSSAHSPARATAAGVCATWAATPGAVAHRCEDGARAASSTRRTSSASTARHRAAAAGARRDVRCGSTPRRRSDRAQLRRLRLAAP
jgi:hypothetical protein